MAKQSRATFHKRAKERARQQKQRDKAQRRLAAKERRAGDVPPMEGDDPARAGLPLGPHAMLAPWDETHPTD
jgi:hypothetical protein